MSVVDEAARRLGTDRLVLRCTHLWPAATPEASIWWHPGEIVSRGLPVGGLQTAATRIRVEAMNAGEV